MPKLLFADDSAELDAQGRDGQKVSVDDFAAALDVDADFPALKHALSSLTPSLPHDGKRDEEQRGRKRGKRGTVLEAPLPKRTRERISREVAYEASSRELTRWAPIVRANRQRTVLHFPLNKGSRGPVASMAPAALAEKLTTPMTKLEQEADALLTAAGMKSEKDIVANEQLEMKRFTEEEVLKRQAELAKMRSLLFFQEIRAKRQAKIKSRRYRKELKKDALRKAQKDGSSAEMLLGEDSLERRKEAEVARAKERLTLKTRKASQWAHQMMQRRYDPTSGTREEITAQLRDKERLRLEIMGEHKSSTEESTSEDDEWEEQAHSRSEKGHFAQEASESDGSQDEGKGDEDEEESVLSGAEELAEISSSGEEETPVRVDPMDVKGRRVFSGPKPEKTIRATASASEEEDEHSFFTASSKNGSVKLLDGNDEDEDDEKTPSGFTQAELVRMAFAEEDLFEDEFVAEKAAVVDADAPKVKDITLPGWGSWAGEGLPVQTGRVLRQPAPGEGIAPSKRADAKYRHVIINERKMKAAETKYWVPKVPYPFTSREQYEQHLHKPIGPEWNSLADFRKRIQPRVVVSAGTLVDPIKFVRQDKDGQHQ